MGIRKMTFEQSRLVSSCFLALVACFYLNQPIEAFGLQGFPTGAIGYPGLRSGSQGRMPTLGSCSDFTREDCDSRDRKPYSNRVEGHGELFDCEQSCYKDIESNTKNCWYFIYNKESGRCAKYEYELAVFDHTCLRIGGPPLPNVNNCDREGNHNCLNMIETNCKYTNPLPGALENIGTASKCQEKCVENPRCVFFVFNREEEICYLYSSTAKNCTHVRGPPETNLQGCPKMSLKRLSTPSDFGGQCPKPSYVHKEPEDGKDYCCCEDKCCYNKCTLEKPPRKCLRYVPNSQWERNPLGYWEAMQYVSSFTNRLQYKSLQSITEASPSMKKLLSMYKQMEGKPQGNFGK